MTLQQGIIFGILLVTLALFINGRLRYDLVALLALLSVTLSGLLPFQRAFSGFSNPAVITVAAVLVLSRAVQNSGLIERIGEQLSKIKGGIPIQLAMLTGIVAFFSAFMNNVGAVALMLPLALELARKKEISPSYLLMPLAFASLLGGMTTLIGTPPNILIASFREQTGSSPFIMFDYLPVGAGVAVIGLLFIISIGWRMIPERKGRSSDRALFEIENYITEVRIPEGSDFVGQPLNRIPDFSKAGTVIIGLVRGSERKMDPSGRTHIRANDILILSSEAKNIKNFVESAGLELVGSEDIGEFDLESEDVTLVEVVVMPNSILPGSTARSLNLRSNYGVNLLAVARQGQVIRNRLDRIRFRAGDVLLLQSHIGTLKETVETLGCLPLAGRGLRIGPSRRIWLTLAIFVTALSAAALGFLPAQVSFVAAAAVMVLAKMITLGEVYESIDWPIIILLGAMIPVGEALESTGGAQLVGDLILSAANQLPPAGSLVIILIATMLLSDVINNASAVVLMSPIGIHVARGLDVSVDPFLMAIAIGASCAFLTPIGHQSNTLVMGPGGYKFSDYWKMGLVLEILIVVVAVPLILTVWPLGR